MVSIKYKPATAKMHNEPMIEAAPGQITMTTIGGLC